jgi:hypothetical protein
MATESRHRSGPVPAIRRYTSACEISTTERNAHAQQELVAEVAAEAGASVQRMGGYATLSPLLSWTGCATAVYFLATFRISADLVADAT